MTFGMLFPATSAARAIRLLALTTALQNIVNTTLPRIENNRPRFEIKTSSPLLSFAVSNRRDSFNRDDSNQQKRQQYSPPSDVREERKYRRHRGNKDDIEYDDRPPRVPSLDVLSLNPNFVQQQPATVFHQEATNGEPNTLVIRILDAPATQANSQLPQGIVHAPNSRIVTPTLIQSNQQQSPTARLVVLEQRHHNVLNTASSRSLSPLLTDVTSPLNPHVNQTNIQESLFQHLVLEALKDNIRRKVLEEQNEKAQISRFDSKEGKPSVSDTPVSTSSLM